MTTPAPALALLILAALLAGFGAAVRALTAVDGRPRPGHLELGIGAGVIGGLLTVAPYLIGGHPFGLDLSTAAVLGTAGIVAAADVAQVTLGVRLLALGWPSRSALREAEAAVAAGDPATAAAAYQRAVGPLVAGRRRSRELDARLDLAQALVAAGDLNGAAIRLHEALEAARALGDPGLSWSTLLRAAAIDADLDRLPVARRHLGEAATIAREKLSDKHLANVFGELGWMGYLDGDRELAGICLAWAGRAAGSVDPASAFATSTTLLAAHLALADGELVGAEAALAAIAEMSAGRPNADLDAGVQLARVCLAFLQGWKDSAGESLRRIQPDLGRARWRSRLALPLIALSGNARHQDRPVDAAAFARAAAELAPPGGTLAELAAGCADPAVAPIDPERLTRLEALFPDAVRA